MHKRSTENTPKIQATDSRVHSAGHFQFFTIPKRSKSTGTLTEFWYLTKINTKSPHNVHSYTKTAIRVHLTYLKEKKLDQTKIHLQFFFPTSRRVGSYDHRETGFQLAVEIQNFLIVLRICNIFCMYLYDRVNVTSAEGRGADERTESKPRFSIQPFSIRMFEQKSSRGWHKKLPSVVGFRSDPHAVSKL